MNCDDLIAVEFECRILKMREDEDAVKKQSDENLEKISNMLESEQKQSHSLEMDKKSLLIKVSEMDEKGEI